MVLTKEELRMKRKTLKMAYTPFKEWKQGEQNIPDDLLRVLDTYTTWNNNEQAWQTTGGEKKMQIVVE
jgi:hypothetical protein